MSTTMPELHPVVSQQLPSNNFFYLNSIFQYLMGKPRLMTFTTAGAAVGSVFGGLPGAMVGAGVGVTSIAAWEVVRGAAAIGGVTYRLARNVAEVYRTAGVDDTHKYMAERYVEMEHRDDIFEESDDDDDWVVLRRKGSACGRCGVIFEEVHECHIPLEDL
jgi:hypothetical protein